MSNRSRRRSWASASSALSVTTTLPSAGVRTTTTGWLRSSRASAARGVRRRRGSHQSDDLPGVRGQGREPPHEADDDAPSARRPGFLGEPVRRPPRQPGSLDDRSGQPLLRPHDGQPDVGPFFRPGPDPPDRRRAEHQPAEQPRAARCTGARLRREVATTSST